MNHCETCRHRAECGTCTSGKFQEDESGHRYTAEEKKDMVIYSYNESGGFWVGEKFGCIHHEAVGTGTVDAPVAIDLHALSIQRMEEVKKAREDRARTLRTIKGEEKC